MDKSLYEKENLCPVCNTKFLTSKVRSSAIRTEKRDTDLCVHYKTVNPYYYGIYVCKKCGHASTEAKFDSLSKDEVNIIKNSISSKWIERDYGGERTVQEAIICYKLALNEGVILNWEKTYLANVCLKLAWLYRINNDINNEAKFMGYAMENFKYAYDNENILSSGMDEITVAYLIGELNKRLENFEEAINWFQKCIKSPNLKDKKSLETMIRDQWKETLEMKKLQKGDS